MTILLPTLPVFTADDYAQALLKSLPRGRLWHAEQGSNMVAALGTLAPTVTRLSDRATNLLADAFVASTEELLADWERSLGLPDPCLGDNASIDERRDEAVARFIGLGGQSIGYLIAYAKTLGFDPIFITEFAPFRADIGIADSTVFDEVYSYIWQVSTADNGSWLFSADREYADEALWGLSNTVLQCEFERIAPAHTQIIWLNGLLGDGAVTAASAAISGAAKAAIKGAYAKTAATSTGSSGGTTAIVATLTGSELATGSLAGALTFGPTLDFDFTQSSLVTQVPFTNPATSVTFTRASTATYYDATGVIRSAATDTPRYDFGPTPNGVTNWIRNSTGAGAVAGTPGTQPTNWATVNSVTTGGTIGISNVGNSEGGIACIDYTFAGTATNAATLQNVNFGTTTETSALTGQHWTGSFYLRLTAGALPTPTPQVFMLVQEINTANTAVVTNAVALTVPTGAALNTQRYTFSFTTSGGVTVEYLRMVLKIAYNSAVTSPWTFTYRIGGLQLETGSSANTFVPTSGTIANSGAVPLGLLIEEARTNSVIQSNMFTSWGGALVTGTANNTIAPDGTTTATKILEASGTGEHYWGQTITTLPPNQANTFSFYVKDNSKRYVGISMYDNTTNANAAFANFDIPSLSMSATSAAGAATLVTSTITPINNGWVRVSCTATLSSTATTGVIVRVRMEQAAQVTSYAGDGTSTLFIWGAQVEKGSFATSLIPTTTAAGTRALDNAQVTNLTPWFNSPGGTLAVTAQQSAQYSNAVVALSLNESSANRTSINLTGGNVPAMWSSPGGLNTPLGSAPASGAVWKAAVAFANGAQAGSMNGGAVVTGTVSLSNTPVSLTIGSTVSASEFNGWIARARYWGRSLSSAELIAAST